MLASRNSAAVKRWYCESSHWRTAMISTSAVEFFSKSNASVFTFSKVKGDSRYAKCGNGKGRGFEFRDGDVVNFPDEDQIFVKVVSTTLNKESYDILQVGCEVNGKPVWVPVWALRKCVAQDKESVTLQNMEFYQELLRAENDIERISMLAGKTCQMVQFSIKVEDSKTKKEFTKKVWAPRVISESKPSKGSKSSKKSSK